MSDDAMAAALLQLAGHGERLAVLDDREAGHFRAVTGRLAEIADLLAGLGAAVQDQASILDGLDGLAGQVTALTARLDQLAPDEEGDPRVYRPSPAPRWWKLAGEDREEALGRLRAWPGRCTGPATGSSPRPSARAGSSTCCACTGWTSCPSSGRCCTCRAAAALRSCPRRRSTRPGSCPPSPGSS